MLTYGDAVSNVNITELLAFHAKMNTIGTVTGVYPPSRFGDLVIEGDKVEKFKQQLKDVNNQAPINGGYFVFKKEFLELIENEPTINIENEPIEQLVDQGDLSVYKHKDFWQCMDTYRDNQLLERLWKEDPKWKIWDKDA
jgi:glucose-1-phosphate cytidylyltransferase